MTTVLALDTSSENCSVALSHQGDIYQQLEHAPRNHTKLILPMLQTLLAEHSLAMSDLGAIAFGCGPGSFTGIRIAAGIAQGLAFGLDLPIYAISNLQALALQSYLQHGNSIVLVCIDARMGEVYWGVFEVSEQQVAENSGFSDVLYLVKPLVDEQVSPADQVMIPHSIEPTKDGETAASLSAIGNAFNVMDQFSESLKLQLRQIDNSAEPEARAIARLAQTALLSGKKGALQDALPSYVRDSVAWNKLPGRE